MPSSPKKTAKLAKDAYEDGRRDERERCMRLIDALRTVEAGNFKDPKCQGQRGQDRSDALYDAYCALKNGDLT